MSQFDRPGRQQGDFQQEGYASQNRQQGSQEPTRRYQGGYGQDEQRGDDWRSQQRSEDRYRDNESSGQGNAWQINGPAGQRRYQEEQSSRGYESDQRRDRAPYESNYGYESSHPSYQARGAGDWSRRSGMNQDFGQGHGGYGGSSSQGSQGSYGSYGSGQDQQEQFDPDYHQWRRDQLQSLDNDYRQFRQERYKKFSDEFSTWRSGRNEQGGQQQGGQQASKQDGQQQASMSGSGDASKQGKDKDKDK